MSDKMTRRDFMNLIGKGSGCALGLNLFALPGFTKLFAQTVQQIPVLWLQAGSCAGCSVSLLNAVSPTIQDLILGQVIPGKHVSLAFHPNVSAGQGDMIVDLFDKYKKGGKGSHVLVMEGAVSTKDGGIYCEIGEKNGKGIPVLDHLLELAPKAIAVLAVGTCSSFGGIPGAPPNPTGIKPVTAVLKEHGIGTPVVNIPGCPAHPDWVIGTVATVLIGGLGAVKVDKQGRPLAFYGKKIHDNCERRGLFDSGKFAASFSHEGCLYKLGCQGPRTYADCPSRRWNGGTNWCIGSGSPCNGCVEPDYPTASNMYEVTPLHEVTPPSTYPAIETDKGSKAGPIATAVAGAAVGVGIGYAASKRHGNSEQKEE